MADKQLFDRSKPHFNIGTIGHIDHGKSTFASAVIAYIYGKDSEIFKKNYEMIDKYTTPDGKSGKDVSITIAPNHLEYESPNRHYAHVDCPGHADYIKNMITGAAQMDGAVLVVSSRDGVMPQTREHVLLARQVGVNRIMVVINVFTGSDDEEMISLIEEEVKDLLGKYEFDQNCPFVRIDAKAVLEDPTTEEAKKAVDEYLNAIDTYFEMPVRDEDKPFLMSCEDVFSIEGRGTVVTGRVERGKVKVNEEVEMVGLGDTKKTVVTGIEMFRKTLNEAIAGDNAGLLLRGLKREDVERGMVICAPGSITPHTEFECEVYILKKDEGGRHTAFFTGYKPQFYIRTTDVTGDVKLKEGTEMVMPGDNVEVSVTLIQPVAIEKGMRFAIREGSRTVGAGVVTNIIK